MSIGLVTFSPSFYIGIILGVSLGMCLLNSSYDVYSGV